MAVEDESDDDGRVRKQAARRRSPSDSPGRSYSPPGTLRQHPAQFRAPDSHLTGCRWHWNARAFPSVDVGVQPGLAYIPALLAPHDATLPVACGELADFACLVSS